MQQTRSAIRRGYSSHPNYRFPLRSGSRYRARTAEGAKTTLFAPEQKAPLATFCIE